ncbi:uncharacterized protein BDCG_17579 [Blastomyces dermatitidis ER-3]|uniref:Uncharacterized protein n=2 Tax=Blastomyces TaxID=229219 RepID=A0A179UL56_BLAGS|nr:uncharacterized protein BDBG_16772 [Blastomyces gilchristii SLH14081]XP_045282199.1 uncharacterized protein BDCG_17579 [Blastomyces dermatitidis ER-3]EQL35123.1 hypothetical protein BDFG_03109 [Blastomyces dermatitidis ATCC 26199]OAT02472.1 hypothetical protein BDCG_17579 [Blastomyces dermatitidis ER-3]OAT07132.1 hypothetical protein BDBG_16772 [Blastomyces gilchristii SLH14081]
MREYSVKVVAVEEWDKFSKALPFVVCVFFHHLKGVYTEICESHSNLKLLVRQRAGEQMLAEAMTPEGSDVTDVEEALEDLLGISHLDRQRFQAEELH